MNISLKSESHQHGACYLRDSGQNTYFINQFINRFIEA